MPRGDTMALYVLIVQKILPSVNGFLINGQTCRAKITRLSLHSEKIFCCNGGEGQKRGKTVKKTPVIPLFRRYNRGIE